MEEEKKYKISTEEIPDTIDENELESEVIEDE